MRHMVSVVVLGLALIVGTVSNAQVTLGHGTESCGAWTQDRQERGTGYLAKGAWVQGYLSHANVHMQTINPAIKDITEGTDFEGLFSWIDNYCATNPLNTLGLATLALLVELTRRQVQP